MLALPALLVTAVFAQFQPFPSDALTVADPAQKTGRRVQMPLPDCNAEPATCAELALVNQLDGFELQPRLRVRFSGPVNPDTLRAGIYFVWLENLTNEEPGLQAFGHITPINQVSYDPATNTAYARPDEFFDQHRRYAVIVTDAVRDPEGRAVQPDPAFLSCLGQVAGQDYCGDLARALGRIPAQSLPRPVVAASVFTTLSATAWTEKARAQLENAALGLDRPASFDVANLASLEVRTQVGANPARLVRTAIPLILLSGVSKIALGSYQSPDFLNQQRIVPAQPSGDDVQLPPGTARIFYTAMLPDQPKPAAGYPVIIGGHGLGDSRFGAPMAVAATAASRGFASIAINAVGHGGGPDGAVVVTRSGGQTTVLLGGGRSVDLNHDGTFDPYEGCILLGGPAPVGLRDCLRQTALDLLQLVRAIRSGIDLDGDGTVDLDPNRIYYAGGSLGALYGTLFTALAPDVPAAVLAVGGGSVIDIARYSDAYRPLLVQALAARAPSLLNQGFDFDDAAVLRYQPVRIIDVPGAVELQEFEERLEWAQAAGDPLSYATHLWSSTLPGVPMKRVLFQSAWGDRTVPDPAQTALIRAANLRETTSFYRHDLARAVVPSLPKDPHSFLVNLTSPLGLLIALAGQAQLVDFLASDGTRMLDINPALRPVFGTDLFETPPAVLTEQLNY